jgi:hypothetical protein
VEIKDLQINSVMAKLNSLNLSLNIPLVIKTAAFGWKELMLKDLNIMIFMSWLESRLEIWWKKLNVLILMSIERKINLVSVLEFTIEV